MAAPASCETATIKRIDPWPLYTICQLVALPCTSVVSTPFLFEDATIYANPTDPNLLGQGHCQVLRPYQKMFSSSPQTGHNARVNWYQLWLIIFRNDDSCRFANTVVDPKIHLWLHIKIRLLNFNSLSLNLKLVISMLPLSQKKTKKKTHYPPNNHPP